MAWSECEKLLNDGGSPEPHGKLVKWTGHVRDYLTLAQAYHCSECHAVLIRSKGRPAGWELGKTGSS